MSLLLAVLTLGVEAPTDPRPALQVKVVDATTNRPIPTATVVIQWWNYDWEKPKAREDQVESRQTVQSSLDGTARIEIPPEFQIRGSVNISAYARGFQPSPRFANLVKLGEKSNPSIEIALNPGRVLSGVVVDGSGAPVEDASLLLTLSGPGWCNWPDFYPRQIETDHEGRWEIVSFDLDVLSRREDGRYILTVQHPGFAPAVVQSPERLAIVDGVVTIRTELQPSAWIEGRVLAPDGQPVAQARVSVNGSAKLDEPACVSINSETTSGPDGSFRIGGIDERTVVIVATHPVHAPSPSLQTSEQFAKRQPLMLQLTPGHRIEGRVLHANRTPIEGLPIAFLPAQKTAARWKTVTDHDGHFELTGLPAGSGRLLAEQLEHREIELPRDGPIEIQSPPRLTVEVALRGPDGATPIVPPASFFFDGQFISAHRSLQNPDGTITLENLEPGRWTFTVDKAGYAVTEHHLQLEASDGPVAKLQLDLSTGFSISGRVVDQDGKPIAGAEILARGPILRDRRSATTDSRGQFLLEGLNTHHRWAGSWYLLAVSAEGYASHIDADLFVRSGLTRTKNFKLGPGAVVEGRVLDREGNPAANVLVAIKKENRWYRALVPLPQTTTDQDGRFRLEHVPAQEVYLYTGAQRQPLDLKHGEVNLLEVQLN